MTARLDFCCCCGCWVSANTGTIRQGPDGEAEIICGECEALERNPDVVATAVARAERLFE